MDNVKFRALDKICNPPRLKTWEQLLAQYQLTQVFTGGNDCFELMLFTGLYDKNGKEIYEGDIIWFKTIRKEIKVFVSDVKWEDAAFFISEGVDYYDTFLGAMMPADKYDLEIIGNIYDNPELLQEKVSDNQ